MDICGYESEQKTNYFDSIPLSAVVNNLKSLSIRVAVGTLISTTPLQIYTVGSFSLQLPESLPNINDYVITYTGITSVSAPLAWLVDIN